MPRLGCALMMLSVVGLFTMAGTFKHATIRISLTL
jgi:hypothetical protein